jgi:DNA-directed RNA polymerase subunit M/transcription elongation factor TFIIS
MSKVKINITKNKVSTEVKNSPDDIALALEKLYADKKNVKYDPKVTSVFNMPTLKEVKEKTDSLYNSGIALDFIFTEGVFQCGRCKNTKVYYKTKQTRSGDEQETAFFLCASEGCKHTWRVG